MLPWLNAPNELSTRTPLRIGRRGLEFRIRIKASFRSHVSTNEDSAQDVGGGG